MPEYGWISTKGLFTQYGGFFVDEEDQILYWKDKSGPAFVLTEDEFGALARVIQDIQVQALAVCVKKLKAVWLAILIVIPLTIGLMFSDIIPPTDLYVYGVLSLMVLLMLWAWWPVLIYYRRLGRGEIHKYQSSRIDEMLGNARATFLPRPEETRLHPSVWDANWKSFLLIGFGLSYAALLIFVWNPLIQGEYGYIVNYAIAFPLVLISIYLFADQFKGKKVEEIRLYEFKDVSNAPESYDVVFYSLDLKSPGASGTRPISVMWNITILTLLLQTFVMTIIFFWPW